MEVSERDGGRLASVHPLQRAGEGPSGPWANRDHTMCLEVMGERDPGHPASDPGGLVGTEFRGKGNAEQTGLPSGGAKSRAHISSFDPPSSSVSVQQLKSWQPPIAFKQRCSHLSLFTVFVFLTEQQVLEGRC